MCYTDAIMETSLSKRSNKLISTVAVTFIATVFLYIFVFALGGIAPFGDNSLTYRDGDQQYLDLLMYFKNVLRGEDSIFFTTSKYLGGDMFSAYTYYLASPLSVLAVLFDRIHIDVCLDIIVMVKACLASSTMAIFLSKRFDNKISLWAVVMLSASYSMNQYFIPQSSNYMWLDGPYMLPLMLLGVYFCINGNSILLAISTALSLSFNWYTGIINCEFCCFWALYEWFSVKRESGLFKAVRRFIIAMIAGVLAAGVILIPSLLDLTNVTHGTTDLAGVFTLGLIGSPLSYFANYGQGLISTQGSASAFAGSFVLVSVILYFTLSDTDKRSKVSNAILMLFGIAMYYWGPLVFVFSIFRGVESFWYRYGYLGIFILIFIAALFWANPHKKNNIYPVVFTLAFVVLSVIGSMVIDGRPQEVVFNFGLSGLLNSTGDLTGLSYTLKIIVPLVMLAGVLLASNLTNWKKAASVICSVVLALELAVNSLILFAFYTKDLSAQIEEYIPMQEDILSVIDSYHGNDSFYRIAQTSNRCKYNEVIELGYDESLAYGFNGISTFLSTAEEAQGFFMQDIGYDFTNYMIPQIINTNPAADSLLGAQYIVSDYNLSELFGIPEITDYDNFKNAYVNMYALPMAFTVPSGISSPSLGENPYENLNAIYSSILGEDVMPFEGTTVEADGNDFTAYSSDGNPVYGWIDVEGDDSGVVSVENWGDVPYNSLFASSTFVVPVTNGVGHFSYNGQVLGATCYELKLDVLDEISRQINNRGAEVYQISSDRFETSIEAEEGRSVMLLLPYQDYMEVTVNGNKVEVSDFEGVFPIISVASGVNDISIKYGAPHMGVGIAATIIGVLLIAFIIVIDKKCDIIQTIILKKRV